MECSSTVEKLSMATGIHVANNQTLRQYFYELKMSFRNENCMKFKLFLKVAKILFFEDIISFIQFQLSSTVEVRFQFD